MSCVITRLSRALGVLFVTLALSWPARGETESEWALKSVPGEWKAGDPAWARCWVKVPGHWTVMTGRSLWRESVTFSLNGPLGIHEVFINGERIGTGGFGLSDSRDAGLARYKVPPGILLKDQWNEVLVHLHKNGLW